MERLVPRPVTNDADKAFSAPRADIKFCLADCRQSRRQVGDQLNVIVTDEADIPARHNAIIQGRFQHTDCNIVVVAQNAVTARRHRLQLLENPVAVSNGIGAVKHPVLLRRDPVFLQRGPVTRKPAGRRYDICGIAQEKKIAEAAVDEVLCCDISADIVTPKCLKVVPVVVPEVVP